MNESDSAFIERMAAAATHEIMNGLASIGQAAGLMGDLLDLGLAGGRDTRKGFFGLRGKADQPHTTERFKKSITAVRNGVSKSLETTHALNRFIHGLTPEADPVRAEDLLKVVSVLARRGAKSKKVEIVVGRVDPDVTLNVLPIVIYRALVACIDKLLENAEAGDTFELSCHREVDLSHLEVRSPRAVRGSKDMSEELREISAALSALGCSLIRVERGFDLTV